MSDNGTGLGVRGKFKTTVEGMFNSGGFGVGILNARNNCNVNNFVNLGIK